MLPGSRDAPAPPVLGGGSLLGTGALLVAALLALFAALALGGGAAALLIDDPGPVVRVGLPVAKLLVNLTVSVTLGALALVAFALGGEREIGRALDIAAAAAAAWTIAAAATGLLTFLSVTGIPLSLDETFGAQLGFFLTSVGTGQSWLITTLLAASVTVLCFAVRSRPVLLLVLALAVAGLLPMAGEGHSAGAGNHEEAVAALGLHLGFAAAWLGGLLVLLLLRPILPSAALRAVAGRYSSIALLCFCVVAVSGYVSAELRVGSLDRLASPYGLLVVVKVVALLALGAVGALHRRFALRRLDGGAARSFWLLVVGELAVMGIASGAAAGLARTSPPVDDEELSIGTSPSELLTTYPLPPAPDLGSLLTAFRLDLLWLVVAGIAAAYYVAGVIRLARRGERWPGARTASWLAGLVVLVVGTSGGVGVYARHLFSAQMMLEAALAVLVPILLLAGAPLRLLDAAAEARTDGSRGVREWAGAVRSAPIVRALGAPLPVTVLAALLPWLLVFTPAFRWIVTDAAGRQWGEALLLAGGLIVVRAALHGAGSGRRRALPAAVAAVAWAAAGAVLLASDSLLLADWYGAMGWGTDALADQRAGGAVLLVAAVPALLALAVLATRRGRTERTAPKQPAPVDSRYRAMLERAGRRG
ncbi:cytochrome c oxidase assembly protein [Naasia sp. SYSU D00057]|uniref:cytochrome c oxidase assembly protein n=1 Tax=Naasia sp. SYSU D00057 TaxID=2817380 RepID=UPI001B30EE2E|nr:cytochrome c oxidase assembly protein [Naasia sp. SYSU D00057]